MSSMERAELESLVIALQNKVETLEGRVEELENGQDTQSAGSDNGLDHRDRAVLEQMRENGRASGVRLVRLYRNYTDIRNTKTAKNRAKRLENHPAYEELEE